MKRVGKNGSGTLQDEKIILKTRYIRQDYEEPT